VGVQLLEHVVGHARRLDAWSRPEVGGRRRRHAVARFPAQQRTVTRVLFEEIAEEGGAGAEHADHDERRVDAFVGDVGMGLRVVDDAEAIAERADDRAEDAHAADLVEVRLVVHRRAVRGQAVAVAVAAEVVEPGCCARLGNERIRLESHRRNRTKQVYLMSRVSQQFGH
jgi:hypothetical protein